MATDAARPRKRSRVPVTPAWPELQMTGPGGFEGEDKLKELCGFDDTLDAIFCGTMGLNAKWLLEKLNVPAESSIPIVIACHHPVRCWSSSSSKRRVAKAVPGHPGSVLIFPPFADAPDRVSEFEQRHPGRAPSGLLGCVHAKLLVFYRADRLRVVVSTANLNRGQWASTRNHLWVADFPARPAGGTDALDALLASGGAPGGASGFGAQLAAYLSALLHQCAPTEADALLVTRLAEYDFSSADEARIHLVASLPGVYPMALPTAAPGARGTMRCPLAGCDHHRPAAEAVHELLGALRGRADAEGYVSLELLPMPRNAFDCNALGVTLPASTVDLAPLLRQHCPPASFTSDGGLLVGFLPRHIATWASALLRQLGVRFGVRVRPALLFSSQMRVGMEALLLDVFVPSAVPSALDQRPPVGSGWHTPSSERSVGSRALAPGVHVPLVHLLARMQRHLGLCRLRELLRPHAWPTERPKHHHYVSSSVGNLFNRDGQRFVASFVAATKGQRRCAAEPEAEESQDEDGGAWAPLYRTSLRGAPYVLFPSVATLSAVCKQAARRARYRRDDSGELVVGGRVRLVGLVKRPELNGCCGIILPPDDLVGSDPLVGSAAAGRVHVRLDRGRGVLAIRRDCLEQGPPSLPWPYMMSDRTWTDYQKLCADEAAEQRGGHQAALPSLLLRDCELLAMRYDSERQSHPVQDFYSSRASHGLSSNGTGRVAGRGGSSEPSACDGVEPAVSVFQHSKLFAKCWGSRSDPCSATKLAPGDEGCGWVYMGSHNFSPAAWGKPMAAKTASGCLDATSPHAAQVLWMANYELGILRLEPPGQQDPLFLPTLLSSGSGHQLGYKMGPRYCEMGRRDCELEASALLPGTRKRIGRLARGLASNGRRPDGPCAPEQGALAPERAHRWPSMVLAERCEERAGEHGGEANGEEASSWESPPEGELPYGEPLREIVVGVDPALGIEWRPAAVVEPDIADDAPGRDAADARWAAWEEHLEHSRREAEEASSAYVLALIGREGGHAV